MFLSPRGDWIGYNSFKSRSLRKTPLKGGRTVELYDLKDFGPFTIKGGTWSESGMIVLAVNHNVNHEDIGLAGFPDESGKLHSLWISF